MLLKHGNQHAKEKRFSKEVMSLPVRKIKLLLKSAIMGDGHQISMNKKENKGMIQYRTVSDNLASQIFWLLQRIGTSPTIAKSEYNCLENIRDKNSKKIKRTINDVRISLSDIKTIDINKIEIKDSGKIFSVNRMY